MEELRDNRLLDGCYLDINRWIVVRFSPERYTTDVYDVPYVRKANEFSWMALKWQ